jgi:alkylated DNA repair protein (DNA oxidative demethylase)
MTANLFADADHPENFVVELGPGIAFLQGFAVEQEALFIASLHIVATASPFRHMVTPGGFRMSVAMTNCGTHGWTTDRRGYRYTEIDPETGNRWPAMAAVFMDLARQAGAQAGYPGFVPDACLVNRYEPGSRLTLHQDKNEKDYNEPIVSVSLGLPAIFLFGGLERTQKTIRVPVAHGDVLVWGGPARLRYHGVNPLREGLHPLARRFRFNLTFRKAS